MKTINITGHNLKSVQQKATACVIALGYFDGVHLGHQKVIQVAKAEADRRKLPLALMSFSTHPINILSKGKKTVGNLMTLSTKKEKLQQLGVDIFYLVDFTEEFSNLSPNEFVQQYLVNLKVEHAVAGFDYSYGKFGKGKLLDVPYYSENKISVTEVECFDYKGEKISSTAIRQRLKNGIVKEIPHFLGHPYRNEAEIQDKYIHILNTMLPADGRYLVSLIQENTSYQTEVKVCNGIIECLQFPQIQGEVLVEWLQCTPLQMANTL